MSLQKNAFSQTISDGDQQARRGNFRLDEILAEIEKTKEFEKLSEGHCGIRLKDGQKIRENNDHSEYHQPIRLVDLISNLNWEYKFQDQSQVSFSMGCEIEPVSTGFMDRSSNGPDGRHRTERVYTRHSQPGRSTSCANCAKGDRLP